jgi:hypothetical protein
MNPVVNPFVQISAAFCIFVFCACVIVSCLVRRAQIFSTRTAGLAILGLDFLAFKGSPLSQDWWPLLLVTLLALGLTITGSFSVFLMPCMLLG